MKTYIHYFRFSLLFFLVVGIVCSVSAQTTSKNQPEVYLPIGGNTWVLPASNQANRLLKDHTIRGWKDSKLHFQTYFRTSYAGEVSVEIELENAVEDASLTIELSGQKRSVEIKTGDKGFVNVGAFQLSKDGYQTLELSSSREGILPEVKGYRLNGPALLGEVNRVENNEGNYYYWGRRGPSTHMSYTIPTSHDIVYYYNEITVPKGSDVIGSYFMAIGFAEGYFGIQVNSPNERRVLFSVWSPFVTDNPNEIPEDQKIKLLRKGEDVQTGEFGNEGSGGQSFLKYNWVAGNTYQFVLKGKPSENGYTDYTAWFFAPEVNAWKLIASFSRPKTTTYLKRFHSFLENFSPEQGIYERQVSFSNQWVYDVNGQWHESVEGKFTIDQTGRKGFRKDYGGGVNNQGFYLRNMGFFNDFTPVDQFFKRKATGRKPTVQLDQLPY